MNPIELADVAVDSVNIDAEEPVEMDATTSNSMPLLSPVSDSEVFLMDNEPSRGSTTEEKRIDDDDSFYGSDKEVDEVVEFSHTDSSSSSSSASESEVEADPKTVAMPQPVEPVS